MPSMIWLPEVEVRLTVCCRFAANWSGLLVGGARLRAPAKVAV